MDGWVKNGWQRAFPRLPFKSFGEHSQEIRCLIISRCIVALPTVVNSTKRLDVLNIVGTLGIGGGDNMVGGQRKLLATA